MATVSPPPPTYQIWNSVNIWFMNELFFLSQTFSINQLIQFDTEWSVLICFLSSLFFEAWKHQYLQKWLVHSSKCLRHMSLEWHDWENNNRTVIFVAELITSCFICVQIMLMYFLSNPLYFIPHILFFLSTFPFFLFLPWLLFLFFPPFLLSVHLGASCLYYIWAYECKSVCVCVRLRDLGCVLM